MELVSYSDSEGSDNEFSDAPSKPSTTPSAASTSRPAATNFAIDKSNPGKIRVNLQEQKIATDTTNEQVEEPPAKRARVGGGGLSGFNAMLPAPKRDTAPKGLLSASKGAPRKVFSLKTGAEPGFSREADAELRELFVTQEEGLETSKTNGTNIEPMNSTWQKTAPSTVPTSDKGSPILFKPLSVARKPQKKKPHATEGALFGSASVAATTATEAHAEPKSAKAAPKMYLFSITSNREDAAVPPTRDADDEAADDGPTDTHPAEALDMGINFEAESQPQSTSTAPAPCQSEPQSLDSIASDLNLSASARRQLLGRNAKSSSSGIKVVNFNTDKEYASNNLLRASGEQVQHNPVRAVVGGKHSLKQLVNSAVGQKEALEESFAAGKRNKREAGSKYGW